MHSSPTERSENERFDLDLDVWLALHDAGPVGVCPITPRTDEIDHASDVGIAEQQCLGLVRSCVITQRSAKESGIFDLELWLPRQACLGSTGKCVSTPRVDERTPCLEHVNTPREPDDETTQTGTYASTPREQDDETTQPGTCVSTPRQDNEIAACENLASVFLETPRGGPQEHAPSPHDVLWLLEAESTADTGSPAETSCMSMSLDRVPDEHTPLHLWRPIFQHSPTRTDTTCKMLKSEGELIDVFSHNADKCSPIDEHGFQVNLNVYDLHSSMKSLNNFLQDVFAGGFYHVGVEVLGMEFMYSASDKRYRKKSKDGVGIAEGCSESANKSGIVRHSPRRHVSHSFKQSVTIGYTQQTARSVLAIVQELGHEFQACNYHIINRNCITFANTFTIALGVGPIPSIFLWQPDFKKGSCREDDGCGHCNEVKAADANVNVLYNQVCHAMDNCKAAVGDIFAHGYIEV